MPDFGGMLGRREQSGDANDGSGPIKKGLIHCIFLRSM